MRFTLYDFRPVVIMEVFVHIVILLGIDQFTGLPTLRHLSVC